MLVKVPLPHSKVTLKILKIRKSLTVKIVRFLQILSRLAVLRKPVILNSLLSVMKKLLIVQVQNSAQGYKSKLRYRLL